MLCGTLRTDHGYVNDTSKCAVISCREYVRTKINTSTRDYCSKNNECTHRKHKHNTPKTRVGRTMIKVSTRERNRLDLDSLQSKVDARLTKLQARPGAICVVREQVFSELFDELIREVSATWWWPLLSIVLRNSNRPFIPGACPCGGVRLYIATDLMYHNHYQLVKAVTLLDAFLDINAYI